MGDTYQTVADRDATPQDAAHLARAVVDWLVAEGIVLAEAQSGWALGSDLAHPPGPHWHKAVADARWGAPEGVAVHVEPHIFLGTGRFDAICPRCQAVCTDEGGPLTDFGDAIALWHETGAVGVLTCPACTEAVPLPDWDWSDNSMAFVHLGFEFWNWPRLSEAFRARISGFLEGHRTVYLGGRI
ncbi:hypothetical protein ACVNF4_08020 [Streptomyces sp. S6]